MPRNAAMHAVLAEERAAGSWDARVLGVPVWPMERLHVYRRKAGGGAGATGRPRGAARTEAEYKSLHASVSDLARTGVVERAGRRDLWVLGNSNYRRRQGDDWSCIFATDLAAQLGQRLLFLEWNDARLASLGRDDVCFLDALQAPLLAAARVLGKAGAALPRSVRDAHPGIGAQRLLDRALYVRGMRALARRWMDAAPPTAVFVLCGYTMHTPIQLAARERGIPVIELQHGMIHESHPGYVLPELSAAQRARLPVPDHLVVFGERFGRRLEEEAPLWRGRWSVGGHPWLKARVEEGAREAGDRQLVLFSQYEPDTRAQVRDAARAARAALGPAWRVRLKPHPREADAASFYADCGAELIDAREDSYALMAQAEVVATVYSTIAVEALAFPCRSVVLPSPRWSEVIADFAADGTLEVAADGAELAARCEEKLASRARGGLARELFGVGEPALDYAALIARLTGRSAGPAGTP